MRAAQLAGPLYKLYDDERLSALHATKLLDSPPEEVFDRLTHLAADLLGVPVALLSLVGESRQFFKSACGLPGGGPRETPLSHSFCKHVVATGEPLAVEDAREHDLVSGNPAIEDLGVVAYLGVPLRAPGGQVLGAFCVIGHEPRAWSGEDVRRVETLAVSAATEIALRLETEAHAEKVRLLAAEQAFAAASLDAVQDIFFVLDAGGRPLRWNERMRQVTGYSDEEIGSMHAASLFAAPSAERVQAAIARGLAEGASTVEALLETKEGERLPYELNGTALYDEAGEPVGLCGTGRNLSARRQAEEALRQSEARFRSFVEATAQVVWRANPEGEVTELNGLWSEYTGQSKEELSGTGWLGALHPADRERVRAEWAACLQRQESYETTYRIRTWDGRYLWLVCRAAPVWTESGVLSEWVGTCTSIDEEQRAREELQRQKEIFETIFENLPVLVTFFDEAGDFELVNRAWTETLGWTLEETRLHPDMLGACFPAEALRAEVLAHMQEAAPGWRTFPTRTKSGELRQTAWANVKLSDGTSIGIGQDVTEQHYAQVALRAHSERLALALAAAEMGTWDYALETGEVVWSEGAEALFGLGPGTFEGEKEAFYARVHPGDRRRVREATTRAVECREPLEVTYRIVEPGGGVRWLCSIGRFLKREGSGTGHMIGLVMDVTQQRRYEEGLIEAKEEAERARRETEEMARLKDSFLSNMSHEIRTPLTSILGFAEVLAEEVDEPAHELVSIIRTSAARLKETLSSVLDLAQLESMSMTMEGREIDAAAEVREVAAMMVCEAERRGLDLRVELPPRPLAAYLDPRALHRILMNLTSNALKFTEEGHVRLSARERGGVLALTIEDTGAGMDPDQVPQLFEPFRQASEGLTRRHEGSGLGLAITARLVELMGGEIEVETAVGQGTRFIVRLPCRTAPAGEEGGGPAGQVARARDRASGAGVRGAGKEAASGRGPRRILLAEDQGEARALIERILGPSYAVTAAASGEEALSEARRRPHALLLLDISLGGAMSGTDLLETLRREYPYADVPAVALTAHALPGAEEAFLEAGFDAYLAKPFEGARLRTLVERLLQASSAG